MGPTFATFVLQLFTVGVIIFLFAWDLIAFEGCETCNPQIGAAARLTLYITVGSTLLLSLGAMAAGYVMNRSTVWVPLIGCAVTVAAYVISRSILYAPL